MKKFLLMMLAVSMSTAMFAQQQAIDNVKFVPVNAHLDTRKQAVPVGSTNVQSSPRRSKDDGLYYYKPEGSMYNVYYYDYLGDGDMYVNYATMTVFPSWETFTYANKSTNPTSCKWLIGGYDYNDYMDEEGSISFYSTPGGYGYRLPMLYNASGTNFYTMEALYDLMDLYGFSSDEMGMCLGDCDLEYITNGYIDNSHGFLNNKSYWSYGSFDNDNIAGSGTFQYDKTYTCYEVGQTYPAPAAPLYAESASVLGVCIGDAPLKNGAELTMYIYNTETFELKETLTAVVDDWKKWYTTTRNKVNITFYTLNFSKKVYDPIWGEEIEPIVIDYPSTIYIAGFENPDVDFGLAAFDIYDCDEQNGYNITRWAEQTQLSALFFDGVASDGDEVSLIYEDIGLNVMFQDAIMDCVYVADVLVWDDEDEIDGFNILQISDDGKECHTYGMEGTYLDLEGFYVNSACDWYNANGDENYYYTVYESTDDSDWIAGVSVNSDLSAFYYPYFYNIITVETEKLPDGMEGRSAILYFHGRGCTDTVPAVIIQGNAEIPDGINSVLAPSTTKASRGTYSITGQRVSDNTKGIVIKNGKKVLNK